MYERILLLMTAADYRIQDDEDRGYKLQLLPVRAVARNRSFRSGNFFILSTTSSFEPAISEESRFQFEEYIRVHLERKALPESIHRRRIFLCDKCGTPVSDLATKRRKERGFDWITCNVCEPAVRISLLDREERVKAGRVSNIYAIDRAIEAQRDIETAASVIQGKIATKDFDVFLCHNRKTKLR